MRQNLVPGISLHAKLKVAVPDVGWNAASDLACRHVIIKLIAACDRASQHREEFAWSFYDFGNWVNESLVIAGLMSFDQRRNRRHDVLRATLLRQENLNAGAGGLCRLDEDEFVFVRKDHFLRKNLSHAPQMLASTRMTKQRVVNSDPHE